MGVAAQGLVSFRRGAEGSAVQRTRRRARHRHRDPHGARLVPLRGRDGRRIRRQLARRAPARARAEHAGAVRVRGRQRRRGARAAPGRVEHAPQRPGHRITMQSFKMYLGKGIENFTSLPVAPGRMWMTDNDAADVIEFGGDATSPSEDRHIVELREALDKTSGVTPIAAGAIKGRIGRLTSGAALRVTLMALLAKTERKRTAYGRAIEQMCELSLAWLDRAGLFRTSPDERR